MRPTRGLLLPRTHNLLLREVYAEKRANEQAKRFTFGTMAIMAALQTVVMVVFGAAWLGRMGSVEAQVDLTQREMTAYDCTVPTHVEAVTSADALHCDQPVKSTGSVNATMRLLQKAKTTSIKV
jgi:hypothetical protein